LLRLLQSTRDFKAVLFGPVAKVSLHVFNAIELLATSRKKLPKIMNGCIVDVQASIVDRMSD